MPRKTLDCGRYRLPLPAAGERPLVMGILNVTPNSFADGGHFYHLEAAISHAEQMIADGADLIDIGAESTRPGAPAVPAEEELRRLMPVVYALRDCGKPISIDTSKPEVMREVLAAGADMINDINAFQAPGALALLADADCALCIMHMQGTPQTMQQAPEYRDVSAEVTQFLQARAEAALAAGIARSRLCIDPGFGFGKTQAHNVRLLRDLRRIGETLDLPLLAAMSRKSMIGALTGKQVEQRLAGSIGAAIAAAALGAAMVRVHDVAETVDALAVWQAAIAPE
ncbi:dihydropteroate synthase [Oxalobacteraceae bacterium CAVE-383]|nr:dihydropteroate synthase [Oxalobacteraceae bacterium CAVE-383]